MRRQVAKRNGSASSRACGQCHASVPYAVWGLLFGVVALSPHWWCPSRPRTLNRFGVPACNPSGILIAATSTATRVSRYWVPFITTIKRRPRRWLQLPRRQLRTKPHAKRHATPNCANAHTGCLDGYAFEWATAEVLCKHQFNAIVTRGSGDGGIDIEVTRNGLKGVVQCKAHAKSVGPHVVRDLSGVMHHVGADFGIIVSRDGFSQAALDFGRNKPIFFLDTSKLIAMQEGHDVRRRIF